MAIEVTMEDDIFFADLNRQISMLIDDDNDNDDVHVSRFASVSRQEYPRMVVHPQTIPLQYEMYRANHAREISKGTGVFIPQSSVPRKRYKQQLNNKNKQFTNNSRGRSYGHTTCSPAYTTNVNRC
ncbi:hypothetical protein RND81_05G144900 [Saponaria officinalis]|uniref:Uncharacterized protein n=1 Tax=Saponaria officinalis TaxID=3572 RepID=A0AAW1KSF2_SAPOF